MEEATVVVMAVMVGGDGDADVCGSRAKVEAKYK